MKGIVFIRNSDVRYDTRLRKAMYESVECGIKSFFFGWIRDGGNKPNENEYINGKIITSTYFLLQAKFGGGFRNILRLLAFNVWLFIKLVRQRASYDAIYVCDLDVALPAILLKLIFKKKIIYDIFDFYSHTHSMHKTIQSLLEKVEYSVCKISDKVIVCTEKRSNTLIRKTGIRPIIIYNTPNFIINSEVAENPTNFGKKISIVYVGTLPKTSRLLYEITEKIKLLPEINLHIAGTGPLRSYFEDSAKSHANISFYGQITNEEALNLQNRGDILFATYDPSLEINRNSAPNKVYEAMALGKPIIVCRNTDADTVVTENECGYAIEYNSNAFMDVVEIYRNNSNLRAKHGINGLKLYKTSYGWSICRNRLHELFATV
jgi:glycosyltransferase involved in cell wall biosynthesis